jgi:hypothetical protein
LRPAMKNTVRKAVRLIQGSLAETFRALNLEAAVRAALGGSKPIRYSTEGECPVCERRVAISSRGVVQPHTILTRGGKRAGRTCRGSGQTCEPFRIDGKFMADRADLKHRLHLCPVQYCWQKAKECPYHMVRLVEDAPGRWAAGFLLAACLFGAAPVQAGTCEGRTGLWLSECLAAERRAVKGAAEQAKIDTYSLRVDGIPSTADFYGAPITWLKTPPPGLRSSLETYLADMVRRDGSPIAWAVWDGSCLTYRTQVGEAYDMRPGRVCR